MSLAQKDPTMSASKNKTSRPSIIISFFLVTAALFIAACLGTPYVGPLGDDVSSAILGPFGALGWALPALLVGIAVARHRGIRPHVIGALVLGDAAACIALAALFLAGDVGDVIGTAARGDVSVLGTAFMAAAIIGVLVIGKLSLLGRLTMPVLVPLIVRGCRSVYSFMRARIAAWRARRVPKTVSKVLAAAAAPPIVIASKLGLAPMAQPVTKLESVRAPLAQPVTKAEKPLVAAAPVVKGGFQLPSLDFLKTTKCGKAAAKRDDDAWRLVSTLEAYDVECECKNVLRGPTVTTFEVALAAGTKLSKVTRLVDDISLALGRKVRIVSAPAGLVGFEIPNETRDPVALRDLIEDEDFQKSTATLPVVLGRDMQGHAVFADIASMPHVIVAGASGSGKSVGLNVMLASLLCKKTPDELRFIMIDPKVVELAPYNSVPHMLMPVVTDMKEAAGALGWTVEEMERRYMLFAKAGSKNIASFNSKASPQERLPYIVVVIDEFADLVMQQGKDVEAAVVRLGQKARAAGIHMILATQRPSVDVITGTIKANFSSRIAYRVAQSTDSRTILDEPGAEALLGMGDMLVKLNGATDTRRVQCPWISEDEVAALTASLTEPPSARAKKTPKINVVSQHRAEA